MDVKIRIEQLLDYAQKKLNFLEDDVMLARNYLLDLLKLDSPYEGEISPSPIQEILDDMTAYAVENKLCEPYERLLFERLVREVDSKSVVKQSLLVPFQLKVNRQEFEFLDENLDKLQKIGFEIEEFGELSFMVSAVPSLLSEINLTEFFNNILSDLTVLKNYKQSDLIIDKLMQHSCKCAVRSGKILSAGEVNSLISQMKNEKIQLQCPHGRPIVVELLKSDVEKWFKRIV